MHPNPAFRGESAQTNLRFARERAFGVLVVSVSNRPFVSHVPFLLSEDGQVAELHLVRSNPICRALKTPLSARLVVAGPDGYVSPDWYGVADQVPTWNYVAVHLSGILEMRPHGELADLLDRQSAFFEERLLPKTPWKTGKMSADALQKMMRMIVPCRLRIEEVDGTWKLNQNKPDDVRLAAAEGMEQAGIGSEIEALAGLMRGVKSGE